MEADAKQKEEMRREGTGPRGRPRGAKDSAPRARKKTLESMELALAVRQGTEKVTDSLDLYNRAYQQVVAGM
jgi:hypothetical protein